MTIRLATASDHDAVWAIIGPVILAGETYALPTDLSRDAALAYWFDAAHEVFVAGDGAAVLGTYYLRANQRGPGSHVANCGYMTAAAAQGRGIAAAMCEHSLVRARERGFLAMQFNCVVSTNDRAVRLWQRLGFNTVGTLPGAFRHPRLGFVDAAVMFRAL